MVIEIIVIFKLMFLFDNYDMIFVLFGKVFKVSIIIDVINKFWFFVINVIKVISSKKS